jgi:hypothetical protein
MKIALFSSSTADANTFTFSSASLADENNGNIFIGHLADKNTGHATVLADENTGILHQGK